MQNQNETVKDVLMKVLNEMKTGKASSHIEESLQETIAYDTHVEKNKIQSEENLAAVVGDLTNQVEMLKTENESIKKQLKEKKSNLAQCLEISDNNHSNINDLSGSIDIMIKEKENYLTDIKQLKNTIAEKNMALKQKDEEIFELKSKLDFNIQGSEVDLAKENKGLRKALKECKKELELLQENYLRNITPCTNEKCKTLVKGNVEQNNAVIKNVRGDENEDKIQSEAEIAILKEKVKNLEESLEQAKLEINEYEDFNIQGSEVDLAKENKGLRKALKECEKELELLQEDYLWNITPCTNEKCKTLVKRNVEQNNAVIKNVRGNENEDKIQSEAEIAILKKKVKNLEESLEQAKLEINEYEEENKYYNQKVNSLVMHLQILEKEKLETKSDDNLKQEQETELKSKIAQMEENLKVTNQEKVKLIEEKEYLKNQVVNLQTEVMYIREKDDVLQEKIKQLEKSECENEKENSTMARLFEEKQNLETQIIALQDEIVKKQKDEKQVLMLQENLKAANKDIAKLFEEREFLKNQTISLQKDIKRLQEKDEKQILMLQEKIDNLENSQNEKQKEIDQCCCVVRNIKATIDSKSFVDNNNFTQITSLENQNRQLQQTISALKSELTAYQEKYKDCSSTNENLLTLEEDNQKLQQQIQALKSELAAYQNKYKGCNCTKKNNSAETTTLKDENQKLQEQIEALKSDLVEYQNRYKGCNCKSEKYETETINSDSVNIKLQNEIKELETELCQRECLTEKLQNDIKDMEIEICRRQCTINHLEQCLDKSNKILAECEKEMKEMHAENENLKKQNEYMKNDLRDYLFEAERASEERSVLQDELTTVFRKSQALELEKFELSKNLQEKCNAEDELKQLQKQYNNLLKTTREKDDALKGTNKKIEALQEALEVGKKEHDKIMNAYKEVKETLSEEIKKYKEESERMDKEKDIKINHKQEAKYSANVEELNAIIMEKQKMIKALENQIEELTSEGAELKAYVTKLISDNKNLRTAIENLLMNLAEKLKNFTENEENISVKSNEMIVKDILNSLIDLENNIVDNNGTCKEKCNCMSVIKSTYKIDGKDSKARNVSPCKQKCGKRIKDVLKCANTSNDCIQCCPDKEKGQDDKPEANSSSSFKSKF
ncbi:spindle pole body component 110-like [Anoplophora glabripennis]|uniref:spindle pole body component 110-like n=1 Tax=Anoplophora glabripennis TaxID=217634 RepID=UPI00087493F7|nr:spindle pole body component 110-like [Anoplophora glabripennis]